jgi:hypothetical protein
MHPLHSTVLVLRKITFEELVRLIDVPYFLEFPSHLRPSVDVIVMHTIPVAAFDVSSRSQLRLLLLVVKRHF